MYCLEKEKLADRPKVELEVSRLAGLRGFEPIG